MNNKYKAVTAYITHAILNTRTEFPSSSLADLYNPCTLPPSLAKTYQMLDRVVDRLYRKQMLSSDTMRASWLFSMHEERTHASNH